MKPYNEIWGNTIQSSTNVHINQVCCIVKGMLKKIMILITISYNVLLKV